jgi:hypothetical protein
MTGKETKFNVPARVHILLARESHYAVIIIRRRSKLFHIVKWNLETDTLERGSWFRGNIYPSRSDLSFDGKLMVYYALNPSTGIFSWTAVCRPPFLKALLLWQHGDGWDGGGIFLAKNLLHINKHIDSTEKKETYPKFLRKYKIKYEPFMDKSEDLLMLRDGWINRVDEKKYPKFEKLSADQKYRLDKRWDIRYWPDMMSYSLYNSDTEVLLTNIVNTNTRCCDWDYLGRLVTVEEGIIRRYDSNDLETGIPSFEINCNSFTPPEKREHIEE